MLLSQGLGHKEESGSAEVENRRRTRSSTRGVPPTPPPPAKREKKTPPSGGRGLLIIFSHIVAFSVHYLSSDLGLILSSLSCSVGIVRSRTQATEFSLVFFSYLWSWLRALMRVGLNIWAIRYARLKLLLSVNITTNCKIFENTFSSFRWGNKTRIQNISRSEINCDFASQSLF
jgi:hypothetical protein